MMLLYPISTKVKHGELEGVITGISIRGLVTNVTYGVTVIYEDGRSSEVWLCDFEFTTKAEKIKWGVRL